MKREFWTGAIGDEVNNQLDSLYLACEIVRAIACGGGEKLGYQGAAKALERTYKEIEKIRKSMK